MAFLELRDRLAATAQQALSALGMRFDDSASGEREGVAGPTVDVLGYLERGVVRRDPAA